MGKPQEAASERFTVDINFTGGSGKARILSPVEITVTDGVMTAAFVWSSGNYDYMLIDGVRYENENAGGPSTFHVPVESLDEPMTVIGDTVAMSTPHEIEYVIVWGDRHDGSSDDPGQAQADTAGQADDTGNSTGVSAAAGAMAEGVCFGPAEEDEAVLAHAGIVRTGGLSLQYATGFAVTFFGEYAWISVPQSGEYLVVPEGGAVPEGLSKDVILLKKPLANTYLVSTAAMDLISRCESLSMVRLSGTKASDWMIDAAKEAMDRGEILYAGRYSAPDYERILGEGCRFVIENTMIYHTPAVKAKLEELGIPVFVETSSYEPHPLGRLEWILLYGILYDHEKEAQDFFDAQVKSMAPFLSGAEDTGKSVAFFHVTANGMINVRRSGDYITKMIELAGGHYALTNAGEGQDALSSMNMQMEDFYAQAADADILIYNSTIGGEISSVDELISRNPLFAGFKAVKEGQVYCTSRGLFQQISGMAAFLKDLRAVFEGTDRDCMYLNHLD